MSLSHGSSELHFNDVLPHSCMPLPVKLSLSLSLALSSSSELSSLSELPCLQGHFGVHNSWEFSLSHLPIHYPCYSILIFLLNWLLPPECCRHFTHDSKWHSRLIQLLVFIL